IKKHNQRLEEDENRFIPHDRRSQYPVIGNRLKNNGGESHTNTHNHHGRQSDTATTQYVIEVITHIVCHKHDDGYHQQRHQQYNLIPLLHLLFFNISKKKAIPPTTPTVIPIGIS